MKKGLLLSAAMMLLAVLSNYAAGSAFQLCSRLL
jgi:hypothetical protein